MEEFIGITPINPVYPAVSLVIIISQGGIGGGKFIILGTERNKTRRAAPVVGNLCADNYFFVGVVGGLVFALVYSRAVIIHDGTPDADFCVEEFVGQGTVGGRVIVDQEVVVAVGNACIGHSGGTVEIAVLDVTNAQNRIGRII
jgi:hypothetical protein